MVKTDDDRTMEAYFENVRNNSTMWTAAEERVLFVQYRTCTKCRWAFPLGEVRKTCKRCAAPRNYRPRDKLIQGALRYVIKEAKNYVRLVRGHNYETDTLKSLISAGNLGLLVAVDRFDLKQGTRFLTYAAWWVREKIREELDNSGQVHVPAYRQKALRQRRRMGEQIDSDVGFITMESSDSIDAHHSDDQLERSLLNTYGAAKVHAALAALGCRSRERYIVIAYFGGHEEPKNLRQISSRLDLSSERVRQLKQDVLTRLRVSLENSHIHDSGDVFTA